MTMDTNTKNIPLDLIDDPRIAMRETTKDDSIEQLMSDMKEVGLIEPIVVRKVGDRYEVIAGHRRTTAARLLQWATIESKIVDANDDTAFQMRAIENLSRKDVDPVDEACYIGEIMTRTHKSEDEVALVVHRSAEWVRQRLSVFKMPDYLQEYLKQKRVTLGAALELAQIENENTMRYYSNYAAQNSVSVATAKNWRITVNAQRTLDPAQMQEIAEKVGAIAEGRKVVTCTRCAGPCFLDRAESVFVHPGECSADAPRELEG